MSNLFDLRSKPPMYPKQSTVQPQQFARSPQQMPQQIPQQPPQFRQQSQMQQPQQRQDIPMDKLEGYIVTPREQWQGLPIGTHIRYIRKSGEFRSGGFIREKTTNDDGESMFTLENDKVNRSSAKYRTFPIVLNEIDVIYHKKKGARQRRQPTSDPTMRQSPYAQPQQYQQQYQQPQYRQYQPQYQQPFQQYQQQQQQQPQPEPQQQQPRMKDMTVMADQAFREIFQSHIDKLQERIDTQQKYIQSLEAKLTNLIEYVTLKLEKQR